MEARRLQEEAVTRDIWLPSSEQPAAAAVRGQSARRLQAASIRNFKRESQTGQVVGKAAARAQAAVVLFRQRERVASPESDC